MDKILYNELQIKSSIYQQANKLTDLFSRMDMHSLHIVSILNGGFIYTADMIRSLRVPTVIDFMKMKSYFGQEARTPEIVIGPDYRSEQNVVILDDILDRGDTIIRAIEYMRMMHPATISVMTMLHKDDGIPHRMKDYFDEHFIFYDMGLPVKGWVYGYGLDNDDFDRNLNCIYTK